MKNTNINKLVDYFQKGCKVESNNYLGLELEHIIVDKSTCNSVGYFGERGVEKILLQLRPYFDDIVMSNGHLIGLERKEMLISLEPGGQIEISIKQQKQIKDIERIYSEFTGLLNPILNQWNYGLLNLGYHPKSRVDDISILPKDRYKYMDLHFKTSGTRGKHMMRGTAATQISIDYKDEQDFVIKFKAAYLLGPLFALITDNAPIFEGKIYDKYLLRQHIWENVDPARTNLLPYLNKINFGFQDYAQFIYDVPLIITYDENNQFGYTKKSSNELFIGKEMEDKDVELALSMVFPDARLKQYIEIRMADSMPIQYVLSYAALIKGLFKDSNALDNLIHQFHVKDFYDVERAKKALMIDGFNAIIYGMDVNVILEKMFTLAQSMLEDDEADYLTELMELAYSRKSLAIISKEKELLCSTLK